MKKFILILIVTFILAACTSTSASTPIPTQTPTSIPVDVLIITYDGCVNNGQMEFGKEYHFPKLGVQSVTVSEVTIGIPDDSGRVVTTLTGNSLDFGIRNVIGAYQYYDDQGNPVVKIDESYYVIENSCKVAVD